MKKRSLADWLGICEDTVTGLALLVMVSAVLRGVLTRYITAQPAVWTSELSGIVFTWVVFIGAMAAFRKRAHINVPLLVDSLPAKAQRVVTLLADVLVQRLPGASELKLGVVTSLLGAPVFLAIVLGARGRLT